MKNQLRLIFLLTALSFSLTACFGGGGKEDSSTAAGGDKDGKEQAQQEEPEEEETEETVSEDEAVLEEKREQFDRNLLSTEETFLESARYITRFGDSPRILNYAIDVYEPYLRTGKEENLDIHQEIKEKCASDSFKRLRYLRADKNGSTIDVCVFTDPESLIIDRIITEEFCADGREVTDYYFSEGKLCYVYRFLNDAYATAYVDESLPGKKCCFAGEKMTGCIIDDRDVDYKMVAYTAGDYKKMDEFSRAQYDELEKELLGRAYITYETVRSVPGFATISGYVGDEFGGYLSNVKLTISSKANEYELDFYTNGDGYFETKVPINTADHYGVTCEYGDYTVSTVDDINIVPGTVDYSLGVIYMAEPGKGVHEANTYLLNANYTSPLPINDGEYCIVFDWEDKNADLKPFLLDQKSGALKTDPMMVVRAAEGDQYKFYVTDQRGGRSGNPMTYEMSTSRAVVKVYDSHGLTASYQVPAGVAGTVWEVFGIRGGSIYPINDYLIETTAKPFFE